MEESYRLASATCVYSVLYGCHNASSCFGRALQVSLLPLRTTSVGIRGDKLDRRLSNRSATTEGGPHTVVTCVRSELRMYRYPAPIRPKVVIQQ